MALLPKFVAIEFPGVLRDPNKPKRALDAIGGVKAVRSYICTPPSSSVPRLNMHLRPAEDSQSNIKAELPRATTNLFLIEISPASATSSSSSGAQLASSSTSVAGPSSSTSPPPAWSATLIGRVSAITEFRCLADFQYHPSQSALQPFEPLDEIGKQVQRLARFPVTTDRRVIAEKVFHSLTHRPTQHLTMEQCIDRLRPLRFARMALDQGNFNYWYRQYAFPPPPGHVIENKGPLRFVPGQPLGMDRRSQPDRLRLLPHRVSYHIDSVPKIAPAINAPVVRGRAAFAQLVTLLRLLFQQRPVWVRRALLLGVPAEMRANFKKAIACVAYSFRGSGPFFQACVKYGYDPRKDPKSRKYQVIEIRCGHPLHEAVRTVREEEQEQDKPAEEENTTSLQPKIKRTRKKRTDILPDFEEQLAGVKGITADLFSMPKEFVLDDVPCKKNNFFQICDIKLEAVAKVVEAQPVLNEYDSKSGFFTSDGISMIMKTAKRTLYYMSEAILGKERAIKILKDHRYPVKLSKSTKRGRLQLKDVIRTSAGKTKPLQNVDSGGEKEKGDGSASTENPNKRVTRSSARVSEKGKAVTAGPSSATVQENEPSDDDEQNFEDGEDGESAMHPVQMTVLDEDIEAQGEYVESIDVTGQLNKSITGDDVEMNGDEDGEEGENDGDECEGEPGDEEEDDGAYDQDGEEEELTGFEVYDDDDEDDDDDVQGDDYEDEEDEEDEGNYL